MKIGNFDEVAPAVFETAADPVTISATDIDALINSARRAPHGRARLLLHPSRDDSLHEMIIALPHDSCDHPHINFKSGKSFLALSGQFALMQFSDDGQRVEPFILSADGNWPGVRMVRLRRPAWHTIIPLAGNTVFLESIVGPFTGNRFAPWFPDSGKQSELDSWIEKLRSDAKVAAGRAP